MVDFEQVNGGWRKGVFMVDFEKNNLLFFIFDLSVLYIKHFMFFLGNLFCSIFAFNEKIFVKKMYNQAYTDWGII